jgi:putative two-component system response regulator
MPEYARLLAEDLAQNSAYADRVSESFIASLIESAPLHDIGKVGVPDAVLLKPGKLTAEEFEQVKLHTVRGRDICMAVRRSVGEEDASFIDAAIEVTYGHHERWDGSGYPQGCAGFQAPLSSRIVHLVDFYDACRSPRIYRPKPIPRRQVVRMIKDGRGADFDPEIADAFSRITEQFVAVEERSDFDSG